MGVDFERLVERVAETLVPSAQAWGGPGHKATAIAAAHQLTPEALEFVRKLVGASVHNLPRGPGADTRSQVADALAAAAVAPDEERSAARKSGERGPFERPQARWHYTNTPWDTTGPIDTPKTPPGDEPDNAVAAYEWALGRLQDPRRTVAERRQALGWVLHLAGDLTHPLHVGDNKDHGATKLPVMLPQGATTDLHSVWDTAIPKVIADMPTPDAFSRRYGDMNTAESRWMKMDEGRRLAEVLRGMDTPARRQEATTSMEPRVWAEQSRDLGREARIAVPAPVDPRLGAYLSPGYAEQFAPRAGEQLYRSAARIAQVLNDAAKVDAEATVAARAAALAGLGPPSPPPRLPWRPPPAPPAPPALPPFRLPARGDGPRRGWR